MALYSEKVMDHFTNPRNVGTMENPDGVGEVGNARCADGKLHGYREHRHTRHCRRKAQPYRLS